MGRTGENSNLMMDVYRWVLSKAFGSGIVVINQEVRAYSIFFFFKFLRRVKILVSFYKLLVDNDKSFVALFLLEMFQVFLHYSWLGLQNTHFKLFRLILINWADGIHIAVLHLYFKVFQTTLLNVRGKLQSNHYCRTVGLGIIFYFDCLRVLCLPRNQQSFQSASVKTEILT
jgi:hypothetical protein